MYWHILKYLRDPAIRYIYVEGGSSAAKTYSICQALLVDGMENKYSSMVFRRFHVHIKDSVYSSFKSASAKLELTGPVYKFQEDVIKGTPGNHIRFRGLDDEENIKGIEGYKVVYNNEWSQFIESHWDQQRKRLRGQPNQKFICDWNPISSKLWQYEKVIDAEEWIDQPLNVPEAPAKYNSLNSEFAFIRKNKKGNAVWIKVTYRDNFWVVGHPSGEGGFVDEHTLADFEEDRIKKPNLYRVYANGERGIMRTGGEFWKQFNETKHVQPLKLEKTTTIHVTLDENVNPYVTVLLWQIIGKEFRQVHELICKTPDNNAPKAARKLADWLHSIGYQDVVFIYGDPSASKRSTVDPNNSSFYDKFIEVLQKEGFTVVNRVARSAPEVALSAAFINEIYEYNKDGYSIVIGDRCKLSIDDYCTVKEDAEGKMQKVKEKDPDTKVTFEPYGHISDAKRYFIIKILEREFNLYKAKRRRTGSVAA